LLEKESIDVVQVERGGDITYHGPGQLVIYTLMDIQRARIGAPDLVSALEAIMIDLAAAFGIEAERNPLNRGVWIGNEKLGSIGIAVRKGVTFHGLALNVNTDLTHFSWINPCGLQNVGMTSPEKALLRKIDMNEARRIVRGCIESSLDVKLKRIEPEELKHII
jgi:lipoate-protein ligase B